MIIASQCLKCESGSSRFQPEEGPSRGLLRDYEPFLDLFEPLVLAGAQNSVACSGSLVKNEYTNHTRHRQKHKNATKHKQRCAHTQESKKVHWPALRKAERVCVEATKKRAGSGHAM